MGVVGPKKQGKVLQVVDALIKKVSPNGFKNLLEIVKLTDQEKAQLKTELEDKRLPLDLFPENYFPRQIEQGQAQPAKAAEQGREVVNPAYYYMQEDIEQLMLHHKLSRNVHWAYSVIDNKNPITDQVLIQCRDLAAGEKLIIPVRLEQDAHYVGAMVEKSANGEFSITWADSLPWNGPNPSTKWQGGRPAIAEIHQKFENSLGDVEIKKPSLENLIIQQDGTSCGACVIQNLINMSDPVHKGIYTTAELRARDIAILGDGFSDKQRNNDKDFFDPEAHIRILELRANSALHQEIDRKLLEQERLGREPIAHQNYDPSILNAEKNKRPLVDRQQKEDAPQPAIQSSLGKMVKESLMNFIRGDEADREFLSAAFQNNTDSQVREIMAIAATKSPQMVQRVGALFPENDQRWMAFVREEVRSQDESKDLLTKLARMKPIEVINFIDSIDPSKREDFIAAFPEEMRKQVSNIFEPVNPLHCVVQPNLPKLAQQALNEQKSRRLRESLSENESLGVSPINVKKAEVSRDRQ